MRQKMWVPLSTTSGCPSACIRSVNPPVGPDGLAITIKKSLGKLSDVLLEDYKKHAFKHYGFTDEELDFIINYDIKYRMEAGCR